MAPRLFSQLNPFGDHHTALSIEFGVYQVARAAITKFEGLKNVEMLVIKNESTWRSFPSMEKTVLIRVEQNKTKKIRGLEMRFFKVTVFDKNNPKTVFGNGTLGIAIIKKE